MREGDRDRFRTLADLNGQARRHARRHDRLRPAARRRAHAWHHRRVVRRRRASVLGPADRPRRRGAARQRDRRARDAAKHRPRHASGRRRRRPLHRHQRRPRTRRCAIRSTASCARRCATARSKRSSANGRSGTTTSRRSIRVRPATRQHAGTVGSQAPAGTDAYGTEATVALPAVAAARGGHHARPVVSWRWRWRSRSVC